MGSLSRGDDPLRERIRRLEERLAELERELDAMNVVDIGSGSWRAIVEDLLLEFDRDNLVLLLGSGISQFSPSNVPTGHWVSVRLRQELLAAIPPNQRWRIDYLTRDVPFEVLMARLAELDVERARDLVLGLVNVTLPNELHRQVADLLLQAAALGRHVSALTTNYDMGIWLAVQERSAGSDPRPNLVIREKDVKGPRRTPSLFHIHGSASDRITLVLDYPTEFQLEPWKRKLLVRNVKGKALLVLGFSARDLDVAQALADARPKRLVWARETRADCDVPTWPWAAQRMVDSVGTERTTALNVERRLDLVLEPFIQRASVPLDIDEAVLQERFRRVTQLLGSSELRLWARWTAVRAGDWSLGLELPEDERQLLRRSQELDLRAFASFYAGRYLTAASLEREAANRSRIEGRSDHEYVYHRNNEAEFYNRGAHSQYALGAIGQSAWFAMRHRDQTTAHDRLALQRETRNLLGSIGPLWPLPAILLTRLPLLDVPARTMVAILQRLNQSGDLEKFALLEFFSASPTASTLLRSEARFAWLGQKQRLINLYRVSALQELAKPGWNSIKKLETAFRRAYLAAQWSALVSDSVRLGRSWLVLLEVNHALRKLDARHRNALERLVCSELQDEWAAAQHASDSSQGDHRELPLDLHLADRLPDAASLAWAHVRRSQTSRIALGVASVIYEWGLRSGDYRGRPRRLLGLALLETS